jgi:hypothetical protein
MDLLYRRLLVAMATVACLGAGFVLFREYGTPALIVGAAAVGAVFLTRWTRRRGRPDTADGRVVDDHDPVRRKRR